MKRALINILFFSFWLIFTGACQCPPKSLVAPEKEPFKEALLFAEKHLPKQGKLVQRENGYAYIKVDDNYINELFGLLHAEPGYKKPPYFRRPDAPGAHISVVYEDEHVKLKEVGQEFSFTLRKIVTVRLKDGTSYMVLEVIAPELENLRVSYGLSRKLKNHEFHISIAKKA